MAKTKTDGIAVLKAALGAAGISYDLIEHREISNVAEGLHELGIKPEEGVSTLLVKAGSTYYTVIRRDDHKIDYKKIKRFLHVSDLTLASPEEVESLLGAKVGYVSLYNPDFQPLIDESILETPNVYGGTGNAKFDLKIASKDLVGLTNGTPIDLAGETIAYAKTEQTPRIEVPKKVVQKLPAANKAPAGKRIVSGITPSGDGTLHIGNYLGAVRQFAEMAKANECFLFVADLHALTTIQNRETLRHNIETLILNELALLGNLDNVTFFRQSDVPYHTELQSILNNVTPLGLLKRAHAYKDKLAKDIMEEDINLGLFNYPILMAADILLYKPDYVPVGRDQKQHIEIARDVAERFNRTFGTDTFKLPDPYIPEEVATVLGTDGQRKMSKSLGNIVSIFEDEAVIRKQVMATFTDPTRIHATDPGHVEGNMVFAYLDHFGEPQEVAAMKEDYRAGKIPDVQVKNYLFDALMTHFGPARERYRQLSSDPKLVKSVLEAGMEKAQGVSSATMDEVREALGLRTAYSL